MRGREKNSSSSSSTSVAASPESINPNQKWNRRRPAAAARPTSKIQMDPEKSYMYKQSEKIHPSSDATGGKIATARDRYFQSNSYTVYPYTNRIHQIHPPVAFQKRTNERCGAHECRVFDRPIPSSRIDASIVRRCPSVHPIRTE